MKGATSVYTAGRPCSSGCRAGLEAARESPRGRTALSVLVAALLGGLRRDDHLLVRDVSPDCSSLGHRPRAARHEDGGATCSIRCSARASSSTWEAGSDLFSPLEIYRIAREEEPAMTTAETNVDGRPNEPATWRASTAGLVGPGASRSNSRRRGGRDGTVDRRRSAPRTGMIPWFDGGHCDPWNHVEAAMALTVAGLRDEALRA